MSNILLKGTMTEPTDYKHEQRLRYLASFIRPQPIHCPECLGELDIEEDIIVCSECGLIVSASTRYVAGIMIDLPYGLR